MLFKNSTLHFIRPLTLLLNGSEVIKVQEKDNVPSRNYKSENGFITLKKKEFRKVVSINKNYITS